MGEDFIIRQATINDIPFLVQTIVEAEKSGTDRLSYSTIFGLSESDVKKCISEILFEEVDGCELSVSSFLVAEKNSKVVAALSAWIEGNEGIPSAILKGNLLNFFLPKESIRKATLVNHVISSIHIEYIRGTIQIGAGYVEEESRGNNLLGRLTKEIIERLSRRNPEVRAAYAQIFSCNIPSIKTYEKASFVVVSSKESHRSEIIGYLPSDKKILMKMNLYPDNQ